MRKRDAHAIALCAYAAVIALVVGTGALEGGALKLVVTIACAGVAIQAFLLRRANG